MALIGYGRWGKIYEKTLKRLSNYKLKAVVSRTPDNIRDQLSGIKLCSSVDELESIGIDAIIIATPPHTHANYIRAAIRLKKPCIVEKPACLSSEECTTLHDEVEQSGIPLLVGYLQLFNARYRQLKKIVQDSGEKIHLLISEGVGLGPFRAETPTLWDWLPHDVGLCLDLIVTNDQPQLQCIAGPSISQRGNETEMVYVRADYPGGPTAIINSGCMYPKARRNLSGFTDNTIFHLTDRPTNEMVTLNFPYYDRAEFGSNWYPDFHNVELESVELPLDSMLNYFHQALNGGDQSYMGLGFSIKVNKVIESIIRQIS